jgi:hypothetical protein
MLRNSSEIIGYTIGASDGQLGRVTDFLFRGGSPASNCRKSVIRSFMKFFPELKRFPLQSRGRRTSAIFPGGR